MSNKVEEPTFDGNFLKTFIKDAVLYAKMIDPLFAVVTADDQKCLICDKIIESGSTIRNMRCDHVFHEMCIVNHYDNVKEECPVCHHDTLIQIEIPDDE